MGEHCCTIYGRAWRRGEEERAERDAKPAGMERRTSVDDRFPIWTRWWQIKTMPSKPLSLLLPPLKPLSLLSPLSPLSLLSLSPLPLPPLLLLLLPLLLLLLLLSPSPSLPLSVAISVAMLGAHPSIDFSNASPISSEHDKKLSPHRTLEGVQWTLRQPWKHSNAGTPFRQVPLKSNAKPEHYLSTPSSWEHVGTSESASTSCPLLKNDGELGRSHLHGNQQLLLLSPSLSLPPWLLPSLLLPSLLPSVTATATVTVFITVCVCLCRCHCCHHHHCQCCCFCCCHHSLRCCCFSVTVAIAVTITVNK